MFKRAHTITLLGKQNEINKSIYIGATSSEYHFERNHLEPILWSQMIPVPVWFYSRRENREKLCNLRKKEVWLSSKLSKLHICACYNLCFIASCSQWNIFGILLLIFKGLSPKIHSFYIPTYYSTYLRITLVYTIL